MTLPLSSVVVVSCEQAVAAPLATRHLADLGARVIKVEREGGGDFARSLDETVRGMSSHFVWLNRSKESIALDLKQSGSVDIMKQLIARADVFVQNLAPGAIDRLGLNLAELRAQYPRLITCSISGYGSLGPYRDAKAYDMLIQAETGVLSVTGTEEHPAKTGIPVADIAAGVYAFSGVLAALYERERSGHGVAVEVSLFDSLIEWMGFPLYYAAYGGTPPPRTGTHHATIAPYGTFPTSDGSEVVLAVQNDREWRRFCTVVLQRSEVADDPRFVSGAQRVANRVELDLVVATVFDALSREAVTARLDEAQIAHAQRREVLEVLQHPQLEARGRWTSVESPVGSLSALRPPIDLLGHEPRMDPIPSVGQHTEDILAWLKEGDGEPPA